MHRRSLLVRGAPYRSRQPNGLLSGQLGCWRRLAPSTPDPAAVVHGGIETETEGLVERKSSSTPSWKVADHGMPEACRLREMLIRGRSLGKGRDPIERKKPFDNSAPSTTPHGLMIRSAGYFGGKVVAQFR